MAKKEVAEEKPKIEMRHYSDDELSKFNGLVQKYYYDHTIEHGSDKGQVIRVLNKQKLMQAYGAVNERGAVILVSDGFDDYEKPTRLAQFENLYEQWQWLKVS